MPIDLFVFAGEKSADLHGEGVLRALKARHPHLHIAGVGGPRMRAAGLQTVLEMEQFQVMGFLDVFLLLPTLLKHFYHIAHTILQENPKGVLTIDYPGFNLRLARYLRKKGFQGKLIHYICPSVWAWGKNRIALMEKTLDLLLLILPFEQNIFSSSALSTLYVGHPLVEKLRSYVYKPLSLPTDKQILALFPGSRKKEIERNLPLQLQACRHLPHMHPAISVSEEALFPLIRAILAKEGRTDTPSLVLGTYTYELMRLAHIAIAKSGTVTLELALHRTPTVVTYAISALDTWIARDLLRIRLPFYALPNIIADKEVFPELIGPHFTAESLSIELQALHAPARYTECQQSCAEVAVLLGNKNASQEVANSLEKFLN